LAEIVQGKKTEGLGEFGREKSKNRGEMGASLHPRTALHVKKKMGRSRYANLAKRQGSCIKSPEKTGAR